MKIFNRANLGKKLPKNAIFADEFCENLGHICEFADSESAENLCFNNGGGNFDNTSFKRTKQAEFASDENLENEIRSRQSHKKPAPLDIFPASITPFLHALYAELKCERSYIMLSVLAAASSAVGSAYRVKIGSFGSQALNMWSCLVGISSGSKSLTMGQTFAPIFKIASELSETYRKEAQIAQDEGKSIQEIKTSIPRKVLTIENETFESIIQTVYQNPKGMLKFEDELTSWLEGMGMYKPSGGLEKDFWIKTFAPVKDYEKSRMGQLPLVIKKDHLVVTVAGGTQPDLVHQFFHKNLLEKGFSNRILFAVPEATRLILPNYHYEMADSVSKPYFDMIKRLYFELEMRSTYAEPYLARITTQGITALEGWQKRKEVEFGKIKNSKDKEIFAGLFGKGSQYFLKMALLLKLIHYACDPKQSLSYIDKVEDDYMLLALKVADYCFDAFMTTYEFYQKTDVIPNPILKLAEVHKRNLYSIEATLEWYNSQVPAKKQIKKRAMQYKLDKAQLDYPSAFNAKNKR